MSYRCFLFLGVVLSIFSQSGFCSPSVYQGEYLVQLSHATRASGAEAGYHLVQVDRGLSLRSAQAQVVEYDQARVRADCATLAADLGSDLSHCEPNAYWELLATPNDPKYGSLYGLEKLNLPAAWNKTKGSRGVIIAVLDTGVDYTHPDLAANMWRNSGEIADNGIDDDGNGYIDDVYGIDEFNEDGDPYDDHGHGTHCAGTVGAVGDNEVGVVGVNWNVEIMALKFLSAGGGGSTVDALGAIDYAIDNGARVINASFGGSFYSQALYNAIERANEAGVLFVAAAGNKTRDNDEEPNYPSNFDLPNVISVAASDQNDKLASFSNYGDEKVHLAAPGVRILSTFPGNRYAALNGTSMAAPHVAGLAGLILSEYTDYSALQVKNLMMNTADVMESFVGRVQSGGRINAAAALQANGSAKGESPEAGSGGEESPVSEHRVRLKRKKRGRRFQATVLGGTEGALQAVTLQLRNRSGSTSCELGELELGGRTRVHFSVPKSVAFTAVQVGEVQSRELRVSSRSRSRKRRRARRTRSLESVCGRIAVRMRSLRPR
ncbi:S8 family serine peptidase [bacterium]|nr:S8 family serine peptidase [bacterium]